MRVLRSLAGSVTSKYGGACEIPSYRLARRRFVGCCLVEATGWPGEVLQTIVFVKTSLQAPYWPDKLFVSFSANYRLVRPETSLQTAGWPDDNLCAASLYHRQARRFSGRHRCELQTGGRGFADSNFFCRHLCKLHTGRAKFCRQQSLCKHSCKLRTGRSEFCRQQSCACYKLAGQGLLTAGFFVLDRPGGVLQADIFANCRLAGQQSC